MKNVIYLLLAILIVGCQKEDTLKPKIEYDNLYVIEDDPSDPVKHRTYEIYKQYGVPVYFTDTVGMTFVKTDVYGNPVYQYELLDLPWNFTSYSSEKYYYSYMTNPEEQLQALDLVENYLDLTGKALYPYNFFVVQSARIEDSQGNQTIYNQGSFKIGFRTLLLTGGWKGSQLTELPSSMMREMVKNKIMNYQDLLSQFNNTSKKEWYSTSFPKLDPGYYDYLSLPIDFGYLDDGAPASWMFSYLSFFDTWFGVKDFTPEGLANFRAAVRAKIGPFGFVCGSKNVSTETPYNTGDDLTGYIVEMLRLSKDEFTALWGSYPLVMKKYNILYDVIANELGVEL